MKFRQKQQLNSLLIGILLVLCVFAICDFIFPSLFHPLHEIEDKEIVEIEIVHPNNLIMKHPKSDKVVWPSIEQYSSNGYPKYRTLLDIVTAWNPDDPEPPSTFVETLQHFNYSNPEERKMAMIYRDAEVPFKLYGIPDIDEVRRKWTDSYLASMMRSEKAHVEKSTTNHFMYWTKPRRGLPPDYIPPTESVDMQFVDWVEIAKHADQTKLTSESSHYYYMVGSRPGDTKRSFVARDMSLFSTSTPNFFITNPAANKGIQCRFAMRGIISECHYDSGKNMIAMMRGAKRYILTPPHTCKYLGIISDKKHPSFRHSVLDWSDIQQAVAHHFDKVDAIDTIVQEGEILYVPSFWFHYIIATNYAIQCNSRSGFPKDMNGVKEIESSDCMNTKIAKSPNAINRKNVSI